jgi:hypothetical protein
MEFGENLALERLSWHFCVDCPSPTRERIKRILDASKDPRGPDSRPLHNTRSAVSTIRALTRKWNKSSREPTSIRYYLKVNQTSVKMDLLLYRRLQIFLLTTHDGISKKPSTLANRPDDHARGAARNLFVVALLITKIIVSRWKNPRR